MNLLVYPILPVRRESNPERGELEEKVIVDSRIRGVVFNKIYQAQGALFLIERAPQVVHELLPALVSNSNLQMFKRIRKCKIGSALLVRTASIGHFWDRLELEI